MSILLELSLLSAYRKIAAAVVAQQSSKTEAWQQRACDSPELSTSSLDCDPGLRGCRFLYSTSQRDDGASTSQFGRKDAEPR